MNRMGIGEVYDVQRGVAYKPEYSWNYEIGGHFSCMEGAVRGDFALFYIDCRNQQLTVFPPGQTTGRMMTNAGRTRSLGAEAGRADFAVAHLRHQPRVRLHRRPGSSGTKRP